MADNGSAVVAKGLKGVVAADTSICDVDGVSGTLIYRGYNVDDLAASSNFEEVAYLLLNGDLPTPFQLDEFRTSLRVRRRCPSPSTSLSAEFRPTLRLWPPSRPLSPLPDSTTPTLTI